MKSFLKLTSYRMIAGSLSLPIKKVFLNIAAFFFFFSSPDFLNNIVNIFLLAIPKNIQPIVFFKRKKIEKNTIFPRLYGRTPSFDNASEYPVAYFPPISR